MKNALKLVAAAVLLVLVAVGLRACNQRPPALAVFRRGLAFPPAGYDGYDYKAYLMNWHAVPQTFEATAVRAKGGAEFLEYPCEAEGRDRASGQWRRLSFYHFPARDGGATTARIYPMGRQQVCRVILPTGARMGLDCLRFTLSPRFTSAPEEALATVTMRLPEPGSAEDHAGGTTVDIPLAACDAKP